MQLDRTVTENIEVSKAYQSKLREIVSNLHDVDALDAQVSARLSRQTVGSLEAGRRFVGPSCSLNKLLRHFLRARPYGQAHDLRDAFCLNV